MATGRSEPTSEITYHRGSQEVVGRKAEAVNGAVDAAADKFREVMQRKVVDNAFRVSLRATPSS